MDRSKWFWMPHPAHYISGHRCLFRLATYVGKYIISTVGQQMKEERGQITFINVAGNSKFETMVFRAKKTTEKCCRYGIVDNPLEVKRYNDRVDAAKGHYKLCLKWSKK